MDDTTKMMEKMGERLIEGLERPENFSEMEQTIRKIIIELGRMLLKLWLEVLSVGYPEREVTCPHCEGKAKYQRKRKAQTYSVFGKVKYRRAYYVCEECRRGHSPLDEKLGLRPNAMSAECERLAGLVGVQESFEKGSALLEELTGVSLSDQSLDKAAQAYGQEVEKQEAEWKEEAQDAEALLKRKREARRPLRLYGTIDGTSVLIRGKEDEPDIWRELKLLAWFQTRILPPAEPDGEWTLHAEEVTYHADIEESSRFGELVWASGVQRNAHLADELIFIADGAAWIWRQVEEHFPNAVQIVDWFHACEYIEPVAKRAFKDKQKREAWVDDVKSALWKSDLDAVISAFAEHVDPSREEDPAQDAVTYFTNNRHRMDYKTFREKGYQIGSGTIESAAKQIGAQRMKVPGARWNLESARKVSKARAAFLSGHWPQIAQRRQNLSLAA
jgi:hypothetical protein